MLIMLGEYLFFIMRDRKKADEFFKVVKGHPTKNGLENQARFAIKKIVKIQNWNSTASERNVLLLQIKVSTQIEFGIHTQILEGGHESIHKSQGLFPGLENVEFHRFWNSIKKIKIY